MGLSVEINKELGSGTLTSITGFRSFETFDTIDGDFTDVALILRENIAEQQSLSQELRYAGEFGDGSSYVVGGYYFGQTIDTDTYTGDASGVGLLGAYIGAGQPSLQQAVDGINFVASVAGLPYMPAGAPFPAGVFANDNVAQDHDGWAVFGQVDWAVSDAVTLTLGARYTDETKKITSAYEQTGVLGTPPDLDTLALYLCQLSPACIVTLPPPLQVPPNLADPAVYATFVPFFSPGWGGYLFAPLSPLAPLDETIADDRVTGTAKVSWYANDTTMVYLSWATGYKAGGTNVDRLPPVFSPLFDAETTESFELGVKGDWGPFRVSFAYFDTTYDDFQAQTFTGTGFNLQNAGKLLNDGYEMEVFWRPTDSTEVQAHYSHTEGKYDSFLVGTCMDGYPFHTGIPDPGAGAGATDEVCDKTGFPVAYNPENRAFVAITQDVYLSDSTSMFLRAEYSSSSSAWTDGDLDPYTKQEAFEIVNLRLGFNFDNSNSNLTLWGRNITDERYFAGSFDQPISAGRMNAYPAEPATFGMTYRKNFD
jgi:outer membrane receptor protein involved in Fe transport